MSAARRTPRWPAGGRTYLEAHEGRRRGPRLGGRRGGLLREADEGREGLPPPRAVPVAAARRREHLRGERVACVAGGVRQARRGARRRRWRRGRAPAAPARREDRLSPSAS